MLEEITPVILTLNEEANIARCLEKLTWAKRIVVIDSFSTDRTLEILRGSPQVTVVQRPFDSHAAQWNFGLSQVMSDWVLSLDADYVLSDEILTEIASLGEETDGHYARFRYCMSGKPLKTTMLPPRLILFRREKGSYVDDGHTQLLELNGSSQSLVGYVYHDDRKPFSRWYQNQKNYSKLEAEKLLKTRFGEMSLQDKVRRLVLFAPGLVVLYCFFVKGLVFDGWRGWVYTFQRFLAEALLSLQLLNK